MLFIIKMLLSLPCNAEVEHVRTGRIFLLVHGDSSGSCTQSAFCCPNPVPEKDLDAVRSFGVAAKAGICLVLQWMFLHSCSKV